MKNTYIASLTFCLFAALPMVCLADGPVRPGTQHYIAPMDSVTTEYTTTNSSAYSYNPYGTVSSQTNYPQNSFVSSLQSPSSSFQSPVSILQPVPTFAGNGSTPASSFQSPISSCPVCSISYQNPVTYNQIQQPSLLQTSWTGNLPIQSLVPQAVANAQTVIPNPRVVGYQNNYSVSLGRSLPSYYGSNATDGVYTIFGGERYAPTADAINYNNQINTNQLGIFSNSYGQIQSPVGGVRGNAPYGGSTLMQDQNGNWITLDSRTVVGNAPM